MLWHVQLWMHVFSFPMFWYVRSVILCRAPPIMLMYVYFFLSCMQLSWLEVRFLEYDILCLDKFWQESYPYSWSKVCHEVPHCCRECFKSLLPCLPWTSNWKWASKVFKCCHSFFLNSQGISHVTSSI